MNTIEDNKGAKSSRHRFRSPLSTEDVIWISNLLEELIMTTGRLQERSKASISPFANDAVEDILDMLIDMKVDINKSEVRDGKD
tara:strand:- start:1278 stop:1529 length:252 start_codon:yes stop_codon:yes gene_type:complete